MRGFLKAKATRKRKTFEDDLMPLLEWVTLIDADWQQAAVWWAETRSQGKQLSDVDLLIAALTKRLDATLITSDEDFAALSIKRETWR